MKLTCNLACQPGKFAYLPPLLIGTIIILLLSRTAFADNPIIQTRHTADPAPMVYKDTIYLYTGHDEDNATYFVMNDWRCYSSKDMVNWTDHGSPLSYKDFNWAKGDAWAGQCIERNGKFYYYVPLTQKTGGFAVGVAVSDNPTGPFKDALGHPLVTTGHNDIDPTVWIDKDGQAYLYWGNVRLMYVKLNKDMISYDTSTGVVQIDLNAESFGKPSGGPFHSLYVEGPWFFRRDNVYYMANAAGGIPEFLSYSTSSSPTGPWTYRGIIMPNKLPNLAFTNQAGITDFNGHSYLFYHNQDLPGGGGFDRSVCVEEFKYNTDGTIPSILPTKEGPAPIGHLNPYVETEAATMAWESGIKTEGSAQTGVYVTGIDDGDFIKVKSVDFGKKGAKSFSAKISSSSGNGRIELHIDSIDGTLIGSLAMDNTGGADHWQSKSISITRLKGIHDIYFLFKGKSSENLFNFASWRFH